MSESDRRSPSEITELMAQVLQSDASEAFGEFMMRHVALNDLAPRAGDALLDGVEASPDGGAAMALAHLEGLPEEERAALSEKAAMETGRRLQSAALMLLDAKDAARLPVEITPEMVAVAAVTELGD